MLPTHTKSMKRLELASLSDQLRTQFVEFEKYIESTVHKQDNKSSLNLNPLLIEPSDQTYRAPNTTRAVNKNFRMRPFTQVSEVPRSLLSKAQNFNAEATKDLTSKSSRQRAVSKFLFEGSKTGSIPTSECAEVMEFRNHPETDTFITQQDHKELQDYIESLKVLSELKFDIKLTYDLTYSTDFQSKETDSMGFFLNLQQELKNILKQEVGEHMETVELEVIRTVDKHMIFLREIIRSLKRKGDTDSAIVIEMLWRCVIKLLDSLFTMQETTISNIHQTHESALKLLIISKNLEINKINENFNEKELLLKDEINRLANSIKELKGEISYLRECVYDREKKIIELTEVDGGFEAMRSMTGLLESLNSVITEARNQKKKQKTAMLEISEFIDTANSIALPPKIHCALVQTEWTVKKDLLNLPRLKEPLISDHVFIKLEPGDYFIDAKEIHELFSNFLLSIKPEYTFFDNFCTCVYQKYKNIQEARKALYSICMRLNEMDGPWTDLLKNLLNLSSRMPRAIENILYRLIQFFTKLQNPDGCDYEIPIDLYINSIERAFKNNIEFKEFLQGRIIVKSESIPNGTFIYHPTRVNSFFLRFALCFEKTKKDLKSSLEKLDKQKQWEIPLDAFEELLAKIKFKYSEQEILEVWESFKPTNRDLVHLLKIFEDLRFKDFLNISKKGRIGLEDFIVTSYQFLIGCFNDSVNELESLKTQTDLEGVLKVFHDKNIEIAVEKIQFLMEKIMLKTQLEEIIDIFALLPSDLLKIATQPQRKKLISKK